MNKSILILIYCSVIMLLTGCWDEIAIEDRGFVVGIAIEMADGQESDDNYFTMTSQFVVPAGLGGPGETGSEQKGFTNLTLSGSSLFGISREMSTITGRTPYYEHLKLIVVSEEVAREPDLFASLMDVFIRDHEMRREIKVLISEGGARDILEIDPENVDIPAVHITDVMDGNDKSFEITPPVRTGDIHDFLLNRSSYVINRVMSNDNRMHSAGTSVFHGHSNRMVGVLDGDETKGLNLIRGEINGGAIEFEIDDQLMTYELENVNTTTEINTEDEENINITVDIESEGIIAEMYGSDPLLQADHLSEIEGNISERMEELATDALEKGQDELGVDIFEFDNILRQNHYNIWEEIKDDWDHGDIIFAKTNIDVSANAIVRTTGATDRVKDRGSGDE